jgi:hypothetical protein
MTKIRRKKDISLINRIGDPGIYRLFEIKNFVSE